ncbi:hypothetical protein BDW75DRAFT_248280 [Aspergillus navahoensis]
MPSATSPWYGRMSLISETDCWLAWRLASRCGRWAVRRLVQQIRRLLAYPLPRPFAHLDMATVQQGSMVVLLLTVNILPLVVRAPSWVTLHRRAANLAVINFMSLWMGWTFGFPAHLLGIDWSAVAWMHRWVGRMVVIHSVVHGAVVILGDGQPMQAIRQHYIPILAACSMILIVPVTLHAVQTGLAAMSYHVWMHRSRSRWCVVAAAAS